MYSQNLFPYVVLAVCLLPTPTVVAQSRDLRNRQFEELMQEVAQLRRTVAEQDRRIAHLEHDIKALQIGTVPGPIPPLAPAWLSPSNWGLIRAGMSRTQVVE